MNHTEGESALDTVEKAFTTLLQTVAHLRSPEGCPWDRQQTLASLGEHLQEEVAELLESVDRQDWENFEEELGDLLLLAALYGQIAEEEGITHLARAALKANEKLIRRHPHVFANHVIEGDDPIEGVWKQWEAIKAGEKKASGSAPEPLLKALPARLPLLLRARDRFKDLQKKGLLKQAGLDPALSEEPDAGLDEAELGKQLFALCAAARGKGLDPEAALRRYVLALESRLNPSP